MKIVAITSLPAVDCLNADCPNVDRWTPTARANYPPYHQITDNLTSIISSSICLKNVCTSFVQDYILWVISITACLIEEIIFSLYIYNLFYSLEY